MQPIVRFSYFVPVPANGLRNHIFIILKWFITFDHESMDSVIKVGAKLISLTL